MRAGRTKVQRYRARLILEWMMKWGFDNVHWAEAIDQEYVEPNSDRWDRVRAMQATKTLKESGDGNWYWLDRDKATRYLEKYGS
jgi:hypothetical protein